MTMLIQSRRGAPTSPDETTLAESRLSREESRALAAVCAGAPPAAVVDAGFGEPARYLLGLLQLAHEAGGSIQQALDEALAGRPDLDAREIKRAMFSIDPFAIEELGADDCEVQGEDARRRFRLMSAAELMSLPPPRWLVANHLPVEGLAVLYGPPGGGKSFVALDLALSIATGLDWLGIVQVDG